MKRSRSLILAGSLLTALGLVALVTVELPAQSPAQVKDASWRDGDILFQGSISPQCKAIEQATRSPWTHCAIVFIDANGPYVIEAVQPVRRTELKEWLARGRNGVYVVKRLKEPLDASAIERMKAEAAKYMNMDYDAYFQWDDERIYCSELVWKIYKQGAGIEVGEIERFGDMDLTGREARMILNDRFGEAVPKDEPVVTPASIFRSPLLVTARSNEAVTKKSVSGR